MLTKPTFHRWLAHARPGDQFVYHTGYLPRDREHDERVDALAFTVLCASEDGRIALTQKRRKAFLYEYRAHRLGTLHGQMHA